MTAAQCELHAQWNRSGVVQCAPQPRSASLESRQGRGGRGPGGATPSWKSQMPPGLRCAGGGGGGRFTHVHWVQWVSAWQWRGIEHLVRGAMATPPRNMRVSTKKGGEPRAQRISTPRAPSKQLAFGVLQQTVTDFGARCAWLWCAIGCSHKHVPSDATAGNPPNRTQHRIASQSTPD